MVHVKVPATSANVGCGYDCLGIALTMYTTFGFEKIETGLVFEGCEAAFANENNLIYTSFLKTLEVLGKEVPGVKIAIDSQVPVSRGLGSSATCVVGGIFGAYLLSDTPIDKQQILEIACAIEGHPDNVAPAIFGGLRASCMVEEKVFSVAYDIDSRFVFQALIPNFETLTSEARKAIPGTISHTNAIRTLSRLSVVLKAFETYDIALLKNCMDDSLHEPYRIPLIHEYDKVRHICESIDSICFLVSGSGSTLLNILEKEEHAKMIEAQLDALTYDWKSVVLHVDDKGACVC